MGAPSAAHPANSPHEMVEEVDRLGNVLRLVPRRQMRAESLRHRSVFIAVVSEDGDILVHRRADTKDVWPGWWDVAVGGVCGPDEDWDMAAVRELGEELGIEGAVPVEGGVPIVIGEKVVGAIGVSGRAGPSRAHRLARGHGGGGKVLPPGGNRKKRVRFVEEPEDSDAWLGHALIVQPSQRISEQNVGDGDIRVC